MNYMRNAWYVAAWSQDVGERKPVGVSILDEPLVIWRSGPRLTALEDRCVHRLAPLSMGRCEGDHLRCQYHGFLYNADGKVVDIPGQDVVPRQASVRRYAVAERHSWIWVWMGDPAVADETLIPPAIGFDDPDWILGHGFLDYAAEAQLINDNLLDFSHLPYVHAASFKPPANFSESLPKLTATPRGVRIERWTESAGAAFGEVREAGDVYMGYDFLVPGILLMWNGRFAKGAAKAFNYGKPDYATAVSDVTFTSQAVTPTAQRAARYFFSWGPHRAHGDEALRDVLMGIAGQAFAEDKAIIEAQQRVIDRTVSPKILPSGHDRAVTMFNNLVARMVREESAAAATAAPSGTTRRESA